MTWTWPSGTWHCAKCGSFVSGYMDAPTAEAALKGHQEWCPARPSTPQATEDTQ